MSEITERLAVGWSAWLGVGVTPVMAFTLCFFVSFVVSFLAVQFWSAERTRQIGKARVDHVPKLSKRFQLLFMHFLAKLGVKLRLRLLKIELLLQKLFLESEREPRGNPRTEQSAQNGASDSRKENFVWQHGITPNENKISDRASEK
jgi:hypothetical protein